MFFSGYPLKGYSLFRDIKNRLVTIGGVIFGHIQKDKVFAAVSNEQNSKNDPKEIVNKIQNKRKKATASAMKRMFGHLSPLSAEHKSVLDDWREAFNIEVHGSSFTETVGARDWFTGAKGIPIFPQVDKLSSAMYMHRFVEIGWMATRALPFLKLNSNSFDEEWNNKWVVLDDSFKQTITDIHNEGKEIASAFLSFMEKCFNSNTNNSFDTV